MTDALSPAAVERWLVAPTGSCRVVHVRPLHAGVTATVAVVVVHEAPGGAAVELVVKRYDRAVPGVDGRWFVEAERDALRVVEDLALSAPRVVLADPEGTANGAPTLVMTRLAGRPRVAPAAGIDADQWLTGLGEALQAIAAARVPNTVRARWSTWYVPMERPRWWRDSGTWAAMTDRLGAPLPETPVLLHRDFHPGNVLWVGRHVTGVVDWPHLCVGPVESDIAHTRINLALLGDCALPDRFLPACGEFGQGYDRAWDLEGVASMVADHDLLVGPLAVEPATVTLERVRSTLQDVVRRALVSG